MKTKPDGLRSLDPWVVGALLYTAVLLTALDQWFLPSTIESWLQRMQGPAMMAASLQAGIIWAGACTVGYLIIPLLVVLFIQRQPASSIGFNFAGFRRHIWVYLLLYAVMLPFIFYAAEQRSFQDTYPFILSARTSLDRFIRWEVAYLIQFFALESFFRGYLLFTLERRIGWYAIFVMTVPYCMIHVHKPPQEQLGAIVAGVVLGTLALRFRSWYGGAVLHALVAATMDLLSVHRSGLI